MSNVKKAFVGIVELLQANANKKVSSILPEVLAIATAKSAGGGGNKASTFHRNEEGEVVAILCYYHKLWMNPRVVEFGAKANSATGLNSMCKDGVSKWTKQQRTFKADQSQLLTALAEGTEMNVQEELAALEEAKNLVVPREDGYGFETLESCLEAGDSPLPEPVEEEAVEL